MGRTGRRKPREQVDAWPDKVAEETDVEVARHLALAVKRALATKGLSLRAASELTEVGYTSIGDLIGGRAWPDLATIARLEAGLGIDLWPSGVAREAAVLAADASTGEGTSKPVEGASQ